MSPNRFKCFYLLDNSIFGALCASPEGRAIVNFNNGLSNIPLARTNIDTAIKFTPFTLLEAIGIVPPETDRIELPNDLIKEKDPRKIADYLLQSARAFYENSPEISRDNLISQAARRRSYVTSEAKTLFDICVTNVVNRKDFEQDIYAALSWDYLFKYQFPNTISVEMFYFFRPMFLVNSGFANSLTRFRIAKRLWDFIYPRMVKANLVSPDMLELGNRALRIKTRRDMVDCELVHFACCGYDHEDMMYPVICFTCDEPTLIKMRISLYKGLINTFISQIEGDKEPILSRLQLKSGIMVFCNRDGNFNEIVEVENIPTMI